MLIWIAIQLVVLIAACAGNVDRHVFTIVITTQVIASSLLAPIVFRDRTTGMSAMLATVPFLHLAAIISATPMNDAMVTGPFLEMWLLALLFASRAVRTNFSRALFATISSSIAIGGALLIYVRNEFGETLTITRNELPYLSTAVAIGLILALTTRYIRNRQVIHRER